MRGISKFAHVVWCFCLNGNEGVCNCIAKCTFLASAQTVPPQVNSFFCFGNPAKDFQWDYGMV